jgi:hypothetical protein
MRSQIHVFILMDPGEMHHLTINMLIRFRQISIVMLDRSQIPLDVSSDAGRSSHREVI